MSDFTPTDVLDHTHYVTEPEPGIIQFTLTSDHVKLLRAVKIAWNSSDYGGPSFNTQRPYGGVHVYSNMLDILGIPSEERKPSDTVWLEDLHRSMAVALQVVLRTGKFKPTTYRANKFSQDWKEYNPNGRKQRESKKSDTD